MGDDELLDAPLPDLVALAIEVPPLLLDVLTSAARQRGTTVESLAEAILAEWAIGEIRRRP